MCTMIYVFLITISMTLGILINTPFTKCALVAAGIMFQITVILFGVFALIEGYFFRTKATQIIKVWNMFRASRE
ncbi:hypothetical protein SPSIL_029390 [Sporomusa silvacetica DSM 10669]|uniref:DUF418 domain-containing protein n=1 Tax=Sporomusa silvacetica DSM 10669 TaxID=1123289 RepID=A0ABZ3IMW3_9FIRM|nr:hypothetical protein SPSIL_40410 [Sporomusa silvacetica DSM 10669]